MNILVAFFEEFFSPPNFVLFALCAMGIWMLLLGGVNRKDAVSRRPPSTPEEAKAYTERLVNGKGANTRIFLLMFGGAVLSVGCIFIQAPLTVWFVPGLLFISAIALVVIRLK